MKASDAKALAAAHLRISQIWTKEQAELESQIIRRAPRTKKAVKKSVKKKAVKRGIKLK